MAQAGGSRQSAVVKRGWSIRAMLYLLIVASILPLIALRAYSLYREFLLDQEKAAQSALGLARALPAITWKFSSKIRSR